jgi:RimJ/RimL family protein N-acetyltransferase
MWRNDDETRRWSRSPTAVAVDEHAAWLANTLADSDRHLWVVERDGVPVATVRHDRVRRGRWEVSVTVAPQARGQGIAVDALAAAEQRLLELDPQVTAIEAHVRPDNHASLRVFKRAGYRPAGTDRDGLVRLELAPKA